MPELELKEPTPTLAPKTVAQVKAEEIKAERALPAKPGDHVQFSELVRWLAILDDSQLARINIYCYRSDPVINMQLVDPSSDNNIDIFYDVTKQSIKDISEEYFIQKHGGGRYKLLVKDLERPNPKAGFFDANLYISMTQYPPKISDLRVVDWDHKNNKGFRTWCRAQKLIDENNMPTLEKKGEATTSTDSVAIPMLKMFMDYTEKLNKADQDKVKTSLAGESGLGKGIGEILLERMKQDDPTKLVTTLTGLMGAFGGKKDDSSANFLQMLNMINEGNKALFTSMMDSQKTQTQMMLEMIKVSKTTDVTASSPMSQMKEMFGLMKEMKWGGPTEQPELSMTDRIIEAAVQILPKGLDLVNNIMGINAAAKGIKLPSMNGIDPNDPNNPLMNPQPQQTPVQVQPQGLPSGETLTMTLQEKQHALMQFAPLLDTWLTKEGWEFAEWVEKGFPNGSTIIASIIKDGPADILRTLQSLPQVWGPWAKTYGEPHLQNWISEFCDYKRIIAEEVDDKEGK